MRVPDEVLNRVVFLYYRSSTGDRQAGTGFFFAIPLEAVPDRAMPYVVTAKHVIDGIRRSGIDGKVYLRVNTVHSDSQFVRTDIDDWITDANDPFLDVAAFAWAPPEMFDFRVVPSSMVVDEAVIAQRGIGVGDETFLTGLFVNHFGKRKNIPIVRVGNIAAMPGEQVETRFGNTSVLIDAYLVEARSIGGLSGSPVFVHLSMLRQGAISLGEGETFYLLGLMHGHWDVRWTAEDGFVQDGPREEVVNMGIAIVVPAQKIMDVLNQPEVAGARRAFGDQIKARLAPTLDTAEPEANDGATLPTEGNAR